MKNKFLIISFAILATISIATASLFYIFNNGNKENNSKSPLDNTLYFETSTNISKIDVKYDDDSFSIFRDDDNFSIDKLSSIPLNKSFCSALFDNFQSLYAMKIFDIKSPLDDFSLLNPKASFTLLFNGNTKSVKLGSMNPDKTGYYIWDEGDSKVGVISTTKAESLLKKTENYASLSSFIPYSSKQYSTDGNFLSGGIKSCSISRKDLNFKIETARDESGKQIVFSPSNIKIDDGSQNQLENAPFSLTVNNLYCYSLNDSIISSCGLLDPFCVVSFNIDGLTHTIKVGNKASQTQYYHNELDDDEHEDTVNSFYYIMIDNIPAIYSADQSFIPWISIAFNS